MGLKVAGDAFLQAAQPSFFMNEKERDRAARHFSDLKEELKLSEAHQVALEYQQPKPDLWQVQEPGYLTYKYSQVSYFKTPEGPSWTIMVPTQLALDFVPENTPKLCLSLGDARINISPNEYSVKDRRRTSECKHGQPRIKFRYLGDKSKSLDLGAEDVHDSFYLDVDYVDVLLDELQTLGFTVA